MLDVEDIGKDPLPLINQERTAGGIRCCFIPCLQAASAIWKRCFNADCVEMEDLPYLSLLKSILGFVDTKNYTYQELADEINIHTGGIGSSLSHYTNVKDTGHPFTVFSIQEKPCIRSWER